VAKRAAVTTASSFAVPGRRTGALAIAWGTAVANDVVADPQLTLSGPTALKVWPGHLQNLELPRPRRKSSSSSKGIGDDEVWVNTSSLDHPLVILPDQAIAIVAIARKVMVGRVNPACGVTRETGRTPLFVILCCDATLLKFNLGLFGKKFGLVVIVWGAIP
jgi:hypothetical protein